MPVDLDYDNYLGRNLQLKSIVGLPFVNLCLDGNLGDSSFYIGHSRAITGVGLRLEWYLLYIN